MSETAAPPAAEAAHLGAAAPSAAPPATSAPPLAPGDHVVLVDGSAFIYRAYFQSINQDQRYNLRADGLPTGAVRLFATVLLKLVREGVMGAKATHLGIVLDKSEASFRKELHGGYKASRPDAPSDLKAQTPLMRDAVRAFGLVPLEIPRYEADDLIATYALEAAKSGARVTIVSPDKDLMQLVGGNVTMYDPAAGDARKPGSRAERIIGPEEVVARFGVPPEHVADVQALAGDPTDDVPGVPGVGVKTAAELILRFGDLETLLARADEITQPKRRESIKTFADQARLSKQLVLLATDAPMPVALPDLALAEPHPSTLVAFLKAMGFSTLTRRAADIYGLDPAEVEADPRIAAMKPAGAAGDDLPGLFEGEAAPSGTADPDAEPPFGAAPEPGTAARATPERPTDRGALPAELASARAAEARRLPVDRSAYETVTDLARLEAWVAEATALGLVAVDTETTSLDAMAAELVGVSLATAPGRACYIPLGHRAAGEGDAGGLFEPPPVPGQLPLAEVLARLKPMLEDPATLKVAQNMKYDWLVLARHGIEVAPFDDTLLLSYVLDAGRTGHGMDELSRTHLGHEPIAFAEVAGTGRAKITFDRVPLDKATAYAAEDADVTLRLWRVLKPRLVAERMATVYETLERPLVSVICRMERRGIAIDRDILSRLSGDFAQTLARVEAEISAIAGAALNPGSPKQVGEVLFGAMGLPGGKKTATGAWSTDAQVLEDLAEKGHELPRRILDWRQISKLKATYVDSLPTYLNAETHRVHTSFSLAATTTGRLSSSDPNLQNIPIRTEEGRKIRTAFVAEPGNRLVSADYSQIELRLLAHMADIPALKRAFAEGTDVHSATASEMFNVDLKGLSPDLRRQAKMINFGIIYGISAFGLAARLAISHADAAAYIKRYFEKFPGIRDYMDGTKKFCREHGYVRTLFGRKCHYPRIDSRNPSERAFTERAAMNAPIQGTAADIIRRAMARMEPALDGARLNARMLLQVHDELVFEVPEGEVEATLPVVTRVMREAPVPALALAVPLEVEARAAANWQEAH